MLEHLLALDGASSGVRRVGVVGGGQLGRMLIESGHRLNVPMLVLEVGTMGPAKQISTASHVDGGICDAEKMLELARRVDVLTVEIEHVGVDALEAVQQELPLLRVEPSAHTLRIIQDKLLQKQHLMAHNLPVATSVAVDPRKMGSGAQLLASVADLGWNLPLMLKARTQAYDGRGNYVIHSEADFPPRLATHPSDYYVERWVPYVKELAVVVVRSVNGQMDAYPAVETVHRHSVLDVVWAPAQINAPVAARARTLAIDAVATLKGAGVFGVEMFLLNDGAILINEIAPRPHNSGHVTQDASHTSQFENHLRAITGLPLGSCDSSVPYAAMYNILGADTMEQTMVCAARALRMPAAHVHMYGKSHRPNRKMGHINVTAHTFASLKQKLESIMPQGSPSLTTNMPKPSPLVSIIMGSDSDLPKMAAAAQTLEKFNVPFELTIVSAHRTPQRMVDFAHTAHERGIHVIIAGAGGAAHLPGMVAAMTPLPVIGVPIASSTLSGSGINGVDALYSIVQMPVRFVFFQFRLIFTYFLNLT